MNTILSDSSLGFGCTPLCRVQLSSARLSAQDEQQRLRSQAAELAAQLEEARRDAAAAHDLAAAERERVAALEQARSAAAQVGSWGLPCTERYASMCL